MPAKTKALDRMLCRKLGATKREGRHTVYEVADGNELIARTVLSHGSKEIDDSLLGKIARDQLNVNLRQLRQLIDCTLSREDYLRLARL